MKTANYCWMATERNNLFTNFCWRLLLILTFVPNKGKLSHHLDKNHFATLRNRYSSTCRRFPSCLRQFTLLRLNFGLSHFFAFLHFIKWLISLSFLSSGQQIMDTCIYIALLHNLLSKIKKILICTTFLAISKMRKFDFFVTTDYSLNLLTNQYRFPLWGLLLPSSNFFRLSGKLAIAYFNWFDWR